VRFRSALRRVREAHIAMPVLLGAAVIVGGAVAMRASVLPWYADGVGAPLGTIRSSGIEQSDGWISFWFGVALAVAGLLMIASRAHTSVCVLGLLPSAGLWALFRLDEVYLHRSTEPGAHAGVGLLFVAIAALIGCTASLLGIAMHLRRSVGGRLAI
jgi:hypothetical protein